MSTKLILSVIIKKECVNLILSNDDEKCLLTLEHHFENELKQDLSSIKKLLDGIKEASFTLSQKADRSGIAYSKAVDAVTIISDLHLVYGVDKTGNAVCDFKGVSAEDDELSSEELSKALGINMPEHYGFVKYAGLKRNNAVPDNLCKITTIGGMVYHRLCGKLCLGISEASLLYPVLNREYRKDPTKENTSSVTLTDAPKDLFPEILDFDDKSSLTDYGQDLLSLEARPVVYPVQSLDGISLSNAQGPALLLGDDVRLIAEISKPFSHPVREIESICLFDGKEAALIVNPNGDSELKDTLGMIENAVSQVCDQKMSLKESLIRNALRKDSFKTPSVLVFNQKTKDPFAYLKEGRPLIVRDPKAKFDIHDLIRAHFFSMFCPLTLCLKLLKANAKTDTVFIESSYLKIEGFDRLCAGILDLKSYALSSQSHLAPSSVLTFSSLCVNGRNGTEDNKMEVHKVLPDEDIHKAFSAYLKQYVLNLGLERQACMTYLV